MKVDLIDVMGSDLTVVNAARVSFNKESDWLNNENKHLSNANISLIRYLALHDHWTPFGHPQIQFRFNAPIFVARQLFKHEVGGVKNEVSRRYVDDEPDFFIPEEWRERPTDGMKQGSGLGVVNELLYDDHDIEERENIHEKYNEHLIRSKSIYDQMIASNVAPEQARMVLPQSTNVEWYWTGSFAFWARIAKQRLSKDAQKETRNVVKLMTEHLEYLFPVSWHYWKYKDEIVKNLIIQNYLIEKNLPADEEIDDFIKTIWLYKY